MLRTSASNLLRKSLVRSTPALASRAASTHAISNPTLANIEKRWEGMPLQEQAELWMALREESCLLDCLRSSRSRAADPPGTGARVAWGVFIGLAASVALFGAVRVVAKPAPYTMTQEYQEETNEFLKNQKSDPFTGITSPGYAGKGMVQSPPKGN
ncbi:Cytochrome c oxidase polypeptide 5 [Fusarium oxysporum f. sp. raphani]|uniref:Cytochrome c oxidase polypeptide 5 n=1 Tax=Fusarium oxysporum f. sp. raphani TaxID=96318 RepID=A0A8J5Q1V8_FUSOX|nr:Cytochrome c oxidase polypeptide 5 [Fusarium oxysporum f. sp. raphani]